MNEISYILGFIKAKNAEKRGCFRLKNYKEFVELASKYLELRVKEVSKYPMVYFSRKKLDELAKKAEIDYSQYIAGIIDAKAYINPRKRIIRISGKEEFLEEIKEIFKRVGIPGRIRKLGKYQCLEIEGLFRCSLVYKRIPCRIKKDKIKKCLEYQIYGPEGGAGE